MGPQAQAPATPGFQVGRRLGFFTWFLKQERTVGTKRRQPYMASRATTPNTQHPRRNRTPHATSRSTQRNNTSPQCAKQLAHRKRQPQYVQICALDRVFAGRIGPGVSSTPGLNVSWTPTYQEHILETSWKDNPPTRRRSVFQSCCVCLNVLCRLLVGRAHIRHLALSNKTYPRSKLADPKENGNRSEQRTQ